MLKVDTMEGQLIFFMVLAASSGLVFAQDESPCANKLSGEKVADPSSCSKYYVCTLTMANEEECATGEIFDPLEEDCVTGDPISCAHHTHAPTTERSTASSSTADQRTTAWPTDAPTERTTEPETETPVTERLTTQASTTRAPESTTTKRPLPDLDSICHGLFFASRPYPDYATFYVGCIRGVGVIFQCFDSEHYDAKINECVIKGDSHESSNSSSSSSSSESSESSSSSESSESSDSSDSSD